MDYKELIKSLRICGKDTECKECMNYDPHAESVVHSYDPNIMCIDDLMIRAANAIEELSKPGWIKFKTRPLTEEEREEHPEWVYIMDCELPDDGQEILVSNGRFVWMDTFCNDADGCYLDGDSELEGLWWKQKPEPPKGEI